MAKTKHKQPSPPPERDGTATDGPPTLDRRLILAIVVTALVYRLVCFFVFGRHVLFADPVIDAEMHHALAAKIVAGSWLGEGSVDAFKPAGYPYLLAMIYALAGASTALVQALQFLLGTASAVLIALLTTRLTHDARAGGVAGLMAALYAPFAFFEAQLLTPAVSIVTSLGGLLLLVADRERRGPGRFALAGLLFGLSAVVRPDVLVPMALVVAWLLIVEGAGLRWRGRVLRVAGLVAGLLVFVAPLALRNAALLGSFVPFSTNAGINLYIGNARGSDGISAVPVGLEWQELLAMVPEEVASDAAATDRWWRARAIDEVLKAPGEALVRLGKKALYVLNAREFRNNIGYHFMQRQQGAWPLGLPFLQFSIILPLALAGMLLLWRSGIPALRRSATLVLLWVIGYAAVSILFFVTARFRLPMVPLLMVPAAWCVIQLATAVRKKRFGELARPGVVLVLGAAICWPAWSGPVDKGWSKDFRNLGRRALEARQLDFAERYLQQAVQLDPRNPSARLQLARVLASRRAHGEAVRHLERAHELTPNALQPLLTKAQVHQQAGDDAAMKRTLRRLLSHEKGIHTASHKRIRIRAHLLMAELEPERAGAHWEHAWSIQPVLTAQEAVRRGRSLERAAEVLEDAAREQPGSWSLQGWYGRALLGLERAEEAIAPLQSAFRRAGEQRAAVAEPLAAALVRAGRAAAARALLREVYPSTPPGAIERKIEELSREAGVEQGAALPDLSR